MHVFRRSMDFFINILPTPPFQKSFKNGNIKTTKRQFEYVFYKIFILNSRFSTVRKQQALLILIMPKTYLLLKLNNNF